jgi:hypothetical protein
MEPALIVFVVLLGVYTAALLYLNSRVRSDEEPRSEADEAHTRLASQVEDVLKTGVSIGGVAILGLLAMMVLMALLVAYAVLFDPQLLD